MKYRDFTITERPGRPYSVTVTKNGAGDPRMYRTVDQAKRDIDDKYAKHLRYQYPMTPRALRRWELSESPYAKRLQELADFHRMERGDWLHAADIARKQERES